MGDWELFLFRERCRTDRCEWLSKLHRGERSCGATMSRNTRRGHGQPSGSPPSSPGEPTAAPGERCPGLRPDAPRPSTPSGWGQAGRPRLRPRPAARVGAERPLLSAVTTARTARDSGAEHARSGRASTAAREGRLRRVGAQRRGGRCAAPARPGPRCSPPPALPGPPPGPGPQPARRSITSRRQEKPRNSEAPYEVILPSALFLALPAGLFPSASRRRCRGAEARWRSSLLPTSLGPSGRREGPVAASPAARVVAGCAVSGLCRVTACPVLALLCPWTRQARGSGHSPERCNAPLPRMTSERSGSARTDPSCRFIYYREPFHSQRAAAPGSASAGCCWGEAREASGGSGTGAPREPHHPSDAPHSQSSPPPAGFCESGVLTLCGTAKAVHAQPLPTASQ